MDIHMISEILLGLIVIAKTIVGLTESKKDDAIVEKVGTILKEIISVFIPKK